MFLFRKTGFAATKESAGKVLADDKTLRNQEKHMTKKLETVKSLLDSLGFSAKLIDAGITALSGEIVVKPQPEVLLTPRQLCEHLRISPTSLWRLGPPCIRVGSRKRYVLNEVLGFLSSRKPEGGAI